MTTNDEEDARRYRALRPYLHIASNGPTEWTCWLVLDCIPWRLPPDTNNPDALVDKIAEAIAERTVPYPEFCRHRDKCAGLSCCPRDPCCCD